MHYSGDPPAICCYSTTFLSITRRLLSSWEELARAVQVNSSPLGRFLCLSDHVSSQPKLTEWTKEQLRSMLHQARRVRVRRNDLTDEFLESRDQTVVEPGTTWEWKQYQKDRECRHYWGQALCCNYVWDRDLSKGLKRLFCYSEQPLIRLSEMQDDGRVKGAFKSSVPEVLTVEYTDEKGEIRYKTFRADPSLEDVTARNHTPDDNTPLSSTPEESVTTSSSSEGRLEYKNILEYREINRHARRKIEVWLNDGWRVSWVWNGLYDYDNRDSRFKRGDQYRSAHWMSLRRSKANSSPSTLSKKIILKFPKTPNPLPDPIHPKWHSLMYPDSDLDSDSE